LSGLLLNDYMPLSPLWCAASSSCKRSFTNAEVEGHFASVKATESCGSRIPLLRFVAGRYTSIKQRVARMVKKYFQSLAV
jgi:hypothetical protein